MAGTITARRPVVKAIDRLPSAGLHGAGWLTRQKRCSMNGNPEMKTKVRKWGNSLALRIPKALAADANVAPGTTVDLQISEGKLIVEPSQEPHYTLDDLLAEIDIGSLHEETGTGTPVGREAW